MDPLIIEYVGKRLKCLNTEDGPDDFFHSAFGTEDLLTFFDRHVKMRRIHLQMYLTYFENKIRPRRLEDQLGEYLQSRGITYEQYVKEVKIKDYRITIEQIPIIATLENAHLTVFKGTRIKPDIFKPDTGFLGDFPFINNNEVWESVFYIKDGQYCKLTTIDRWQYSRYLINIENAIAQTSLSKTLDLVPQTLEGLLYQRNIATILRLNALKIASMPGMCPYKEDDWRLSLNDESGFNDIIFERLPAEDAVLVQPTFRSENISFDDLFNPNERFSLLRFFRYYKAVNIYIENIIICVNTDIEDDLKLCLNKDIVKEDHLLYVKGSSSQNHPLYTLRKEMVEEERRQFRKCSGKEEKIYSSSCSEEEEMFRYQDFIEKIQIIACYVVNEYPYSQIIQQHTAWSLSQLGFRDDFEYAKHLNTDMVKWQNEQKTSKYLFQAGAQGHLCQFKSRQFCERLRSLKISYNKDIIDTIEHVIYTWDGILHIIPHNNVYALSLIGVYQALHNKADNMLVFSTDDDVDLQKRMMETFMLVNYHYLVILCSKKRSQNYDPYITKQIVAGVETVYEPKSMCSIVMEKTTILIGEEDDTLIEAVKKINENICKTVKMEVNFSDFSEDSQAELLEKVVMFYEATLL